MKYSNIISSIAALVASSMVVAIEGWLANYIDNSVLSLTLAVVISAIAAIAFEAVFNFIPKKSRWFRRFIYPLAKFEGMWIQIHEKTNQIAICNVEYNSDNEEYSFNGKHFTDTGFVVSFTSNALNYDTRINGFDYLVQGQHDDGEFVQCWGYITFSAFNEIENNTSGKGSFVEMGSNLNKVNFSLIRPEKELLTRLKKASETQYKEILENYYH